MASKTGTPEQRLQTISDNIVNIERGTLVAGRLSFQIRNIASLAVRPNGDSIWENFPQSANPIAALITLFVILPAMLVYSILSAIFGWGPPKYELALITNAATSFRLLSNDEQFLVRVKSAIESAMHDPEGVHLEFNIAEQKIEKVESIVNTVTNSPGANFIGGDAQYVNQTTNVAQGLSDISQLLSIVERSNREDVAQIKANLEVVRNHLAGGIKTKPEARQAWTEFVDKMGSIAHVDTAIWDLVARTAKLIS